MKATIFAVGAGTVLGLDMDLSITADRALFAGLAEQVRGVGGRVVVIAARPQVLLPHLRKELEESSIRYDEAHCLPEVEEAVAACPFRETLGWYRSYLWHKVRIAQTAGVTDYVDDEAAVHDLFRNYFPAARRYYPWELNPLLGRERGAAGVMASPETAKDVAHESGARPGASTAAANMPDTGSAPGLSGADLEKIPLAPVDPDFVAPPSAAAPGGMAVVYAVCAEGEAFPEVVASLGGRILGPSPMYLTGSWLVVLPNSVTLHSGELGANGRTCRFTYVKRF